MDVATLQAWELALYGDPDTWYDDDVIDGCEPLAEFEVNAYRQTEAWDALEPLLHEVPERAMADPRWAEADRDWSRCMAEDGYDVRDEDDLITTISERVFDAWEAATPPPGEPPPENRLVPMPWFVETETWDELVQFELDLMQAHLGCEQGLDRELLAEYQQRFLDENQDLIQQLQTELAERPAP